MTGGQVEPEDPEGPGSPEGPERAGTLPDPPSPTVSGQTEGAPGGPPPAPPGGAAPQPPPAPGLPVAGEPWRPAAGPPKRRRKGLAAGLVAAGAVAVVLFLKFGTKLLVVAVAGAALSSVFGGPFERLPDQPQKEFQERFDAAMGDQLKGLSDAEITTKVDDMLWQGLSRLDDEHLMERIKLASTILAAADEPSCARMARANAQGKQDEKAMEEALAKVDVESLGRWYDINLLGLEAQVAGMPPQRKPDEAAVNDVVDTVFQGLTDEESGVIGDLYAEDGPILTDAEACTALRALYDHIGALEAKDLAVMALYDVTP